MAAHIPSEHGFNPSCGCYGVHVNRAESRFETSASMEILYDEFIDYRHTPHRAVLPWNGAKVTDAYVERLLNLAKVPINIQQDNAVGMILRCVDGIVNDPKKPQLCSVFVEIMSDNDTADYSALFREEEDDDEVYEQGDV